MRKRQYSGKGGGLHQSQIQSQKRRTRVSVPHDLKYRCVPESKRLRNFFAHNGAFATYTA
jgi:hypothetical protein